MRITVKLLDDEREALHPFPHVGVAHRNPHPRARRDHRNAFSVAALPVDNDGWCSVGGRRRLIVDQDGLRERKGRCVRFSRWPNPTWAMIAPGANASDRDLQPLRVSPATPPLDTRITAIWPKNRSYVYSYERS